jgi:iron(III) transport system permease protein
MDSLGVANFVELFGTTDFRAAIQNSLILGILGASTCAGIGLFLAFWVVRRPARQTAAVDYLVSLPLGVPGTVFGVGMLWVLVMTPLYLTLWSLLLAFIIRYAVYGVRMMAAGMVQIDKTLEDAGRVSGATTLGTFLRINLPLLRSAAGSVWVLVFLLVMQELSSSIMLYGVSTKTLPILTWTYLDDGFYGAASAAAIVQLSLVAAVVALFSLVLRVNVRPGAQV